MALYDGTNAPLIKVYLDTGNRNSGLFTLGFSTLAPTGTDVLAKYTPFTTLTQIQTEDVKSIAIRRGRTREDQTIQAGTLTLTMDNTLGTYDPEYSISQSIIAATGNGTTTVYTTDAAHYFKVGQVISITGMSTSSFNLKLQIITAITSNTFTVANGTPSGSLSGQSGLGAIGYFTSTNKSLLVAGTGVRVTASITRSGGVSEVALFTGFIEQVDKDLSLQPVTTITCVDGLGMLSRMFSNINTAYLGDATAIGRILDDAGWNQNFYYTSDRYIVSNLITGDTPVDVLTAIDPIVKTQPGAMFYCNVAGDVNWLGYSAFAPGSWAGKTKRFTMTDSRASTDVVEYDTISVIGGEKYRRNTVTVHNTAPNGYENYTTKTNRTSVANYGPFAAQIESFYSNGPGNSDVNEIAQQLADQFADSQYRVDNIGFECVGFSTELWYNIITSDLGSAVIVNRTPIYTNGYEFVYQCYIQELNHDIKPNSWRMSLTLSPGT